MHYVCNLITVSKRMNNSTGTWYLFRARGYIFPFSLRGPPEDAAGSWYSLWPAEPGDLAPLESPAGCEGLWRVARGAGPAACTQDKRAAKGLERGPFQTGRLGQCGHTAQVSLMWFFCCFNLLSSVGEPSKGQFLARGTQHTSVGYWEFWAAIKEGRNKFLINISMAQIEGKNQARNNLLIPPFEFRSVVLTPRLSLASKQLRVRQCYHWWQGQTLIDLSRSDLD